MSFTIAITIEATRQATRIAIVMAQMRGTSAMLGERGR